MSDINNVMNNMLGSFNTGTGMGDEFKEQMEAIQKQAQQDKIDQAIRDINNARINGYAESCSKANQKAQQISF